MCPAESIDSPLNSISGQSIPAVSSASEPVRVTAQTPAFSAISSVATSRSMLDPSGRSYGNETSPSGVIVLGSFCWAASVTVNAPPAPSVTSISTVFKLPSELVKYGMVSAPAILVPVMVLLVSVIENALRATLKPPNISRDRGPALRSMPRVPLNPKAPNCMLSRSTLAFWHVDVDGQAVLAADGQDVAAERGIDLAQQPGDPGFDQAGGSRCRHPFAAVEKAAAMAANCWAIMSSFVATSPALVSPVNRVVKRDVNCVVAAKADAAAEEPPGTRLWAV